ncbi:MAG: bifunctional (p)ppGpp synthetase/guanosine-3',5'-bis(diphosphate) 3'-pyrophosphohydrolase [Ruminococcaceae bacterium]|jgi:GTP pyrophosphokinase|nr:bifunctional (p)ppGpp synthetase/guanosine-3',5'-bis(diphosphate) 3'-pyrophosphohydrolase [Oscillospiraceae bacterium]
MSDDPRADYEQLREILSSQYSEGELGVVDAAFEKAFEAHKAQLRHSGQPYIIHPIAVAKILAELGMDYQSVAAALLHDTVEDTDVTLDDIKNEFGNDIASLVDGVTKLGKVPWISREEQQAENVRKLLLAMSEDIRVIIIKLADRTHNMRTLDFVAPQKRRDTALETLEIYAPIAHRLGIRAIKEELEDRAIRFLDPIAYQDIEKYVDNMTRSRGDFLKQIKENIYKRVSSEVSNVIIEARIKSAHGIYRKMYMQQKSFDEIYDIFAVRLIVDSVIDCYNCLGIIHDMYKPLPGRFKDYISTPKPNMYQSLHTTLLGKEGIPFEVQIRTKEMNHTAEYGIAAHWKYKDGVKDNVRFEERLSWIRQMLETQTSSSDVKEIVRTIKTDLAPEETFVFTPKGDVINLPVGATVIDFAYAIHSAVGHKMVGAKVDGRIVPLDYKVKTGEIIEVLTSSQQGKGPSRDWLSIVTTSQARSKIRAWFKKERKEENIVEGKAEVESQFRKSFIRFSDDEELEGFLEKIAERQRCNSVEEFYAAIGYGGINLKNLMPNIREEYHKLAASQEKVPDEIIPVAPRKSASSNGVVVEGIDNCLVKLSKCCNPLPGDSIIGFITRGHGVSIHKRDCPNVPKNIAYSSEPERWINASWDKNVKTESFQATLQITCIQRIGLMADISTLLANMHVNINAISTREYKDTRNELLLTITVSSLEHLNNVIGKIKKIDSILEIERTGL